MPITKDGDGEQWKDRTRDTDEDGIVTMPRTWLFYITPDEENAWPTLEEIEQATEVEQYDEHPDAPRCTARTCSVRPAETPYAYFVTWTYTDAPMKGDGGWPEEQDPEDPVRKEKNNKEPGYLRPPSVSFARKEIKVAPRLDRDGDPVVNKAGDPIEGLEIERSILQITIEWLSIALTTAHIVKYWDAVNSDAYVPIPGGQSFSSGTLRVCDYQFKWSYENIGDSTALLLAATVILEHDPDGWGVTVMNRGRREIPSGGGPLRWITDDSGQPISEPVPLTVGGQRLPSGDDPNYITFNFKKAWPFTTIAADPLADPPVEAQIGLII